jgi:predicted transposase YbfD/YdcC
LNEIPAAQTLIAAMGLSGRVFTLDAMHCHKTFEIVKATGNDRNIRQRQPQPLGH